MSGQLLVNEIFHSIQGESTHAGLPCSFVRLAGCPLRCRWCDTVYARETGDYMGIDWIVSQVDSLGSDLVEVTGGEPLAQAGAHTLLSELCDTGRTVLLETSGALDNRTGGPQGACDHGPQMPVFGHERPHGAWQHR